MLGWGGWRVTARASSPIAAFVDQLAGHVGRSAFILTQPRGHELDTWLAAVEADDLRPLHPFATGVHRDYDAVRNGLTLTHTLAPSRVTATGCSNARCTAEPTSTFYRKRVLLT